jgi:hypothetical protein
MLKQKRNFVEIIPYESCLKALFQAKEERKIKYLIGKSGTGKTTLFNRIQIECYESFFQKKELDYLKSEKRVLPVYIEIKNFFLKIIEKINFSDDKIADLGQILKNISIEFLRQIENTYEELRGLGIIDIKIFKKVNEIISNATDDIDKRSSIITENIEESIKNLFIKLNHSIQKVNYDAGNNEIIEDLNTKEKLTKYWKVLFNTDRIKDAIYELKRLKEYPINYIHFLLDNFSEISLLNQKLMIDNLIQPLFSDMEIICFCIACYPHYYYADSIKYQDYELINLDWLDIDSECTINDKIKNGVNLLTQIIYKRLQNSLLQVFPNENSLNIIFEDKSLFLKTLFYACMNSPKIGGMLLCHPLCVQSLKMKKAITINEIKKASAYVYEELIYKEYFRSLLKDKKSNDYFSEKEIIQDKVIFDKLIDIMKKGFKNGNKSYFIINESLIQDDFKLLSRLELMGFLIKVNTSHLEESHKLFNWQSNDNDLYGLYYLYYGIYIKNDIDFILDEIIDNWLEYYDKYNITLDLYEVLLTFEYYKCQNLECSKVWPVTCLDEIKRLNYKCDNCNTGKIEKEGLFYVNSIYNKNEVPHRYLLDKSDFDQILAQLNEDQFRIIHTLYVNKDVNKGWMTTDEIGILKRTFPSQLPHIRITRIIRSINNLSKAKPLINEAEEGKKLYRISNLGILFEEYCSWKLNF